MNSLKVPKVFSNALSVILVKPSLTLILTSANFASESFNDKNRSTIEYYHGDFFKAFLFLFYLAYSNEWYFSISMKSDKNFKRIDVKD